MTDILDPVIVDPKQAEPELAHLVGLDASVPVPADAAPAPTGWFQRLVGWFRDATGGASSWPLIVLFGLNVVDELDQNAFGLLAPSIRDTFDISDATFTRIVTSSGALVIMLVIPMGRLADRFKRTRLTFIAAGLWTAMTVLTGVSGFVGVLPLLVAVRFGSGIGRVMNEPVHASLLADYYPPARHGRIFSIHRMANPIGVLVTLPIGVLAHFVGWKSTFFFLALPTLAFILAATRLREPLRGESVDPLAAAAAEERGEKVSLKDAWRRLSSIPTLKRTWFASFLLGAAIIPIATFFAFFYEKVYNLGIVPRGGISAVFGIGSIIGLVSGARISERTINRLDFGGLAKSAGLVLLATGAALLFTATAPFLGLSILGSFLTGVALAGFTSYHLPLVAAVAPPRLRGQAFSYFAFFLGLGAIVGGSFVSGIAEDKGYRWGISVLSLGVAGAGAIYASAARYAQRDVLAAFASLNAEAEATGFTGDGPPPLLACRGVEVAYDQVQILFGVDLVVRPGEVVALLGTNGAGKSTLLRAISGTVDPIGGSIFFDGQDLTHSDPIACVTAGLVQVPGGKAVFPTLTVAEHLRAAGWLYKKDQEYLKEATAEVLRIFPRLEERIDQMAGNLSGGEQQMLALGMAFIAKPKLLMIDELSLGLAPTIVEQLLGIVRRIQESGTAIILVEQSINVALTVAERAYFLEKGEVRFEGPTAELMERDDIVRSVFLQGAASTELNGGGAKVEPKAKAAERTIGGTVLELAGVKKSFGGVKAVQGASFHLRQGEILGLIGPNGAGKTTIFDLISGFLIPDEGRITFDGQDVTTLSPDKRAWMGLGRSFQDARLIPSLTVAETMAIGLERHIPLRDPLASFLGLPGVVLQEQDVAWTVHDLIELMQLGAYRDKFIRELSTGTRRIVDLAMCIAHDPKVLLLDEPSSGIAQKETEALGPLLLRIQEESGCGLLVIEHDMPLITGISDRMIALELGVPIVEGTPEEVTTNPRVVSSYLGGDMATINRSGANPTPVEQIEQTTGVVDAPPRRKPRVAAGRAPKA